MTSSDEPTDDEIVEAGDAFMSHLHDLLEGGHLVANPMVTLRVSDDVSLPILLFGIEYGGEEQLSYFAIGLNPQLLDRLEFPEPRICQTCVDEEAAQILAGVDLDAGLNELRHNDHPPTDQTEE